MYRPFTKKYLYYYSPIIHRQGKYEGMPKTNKIIYVTGPSARREFSALMIEHIPDAHLMDTGQAYSILNLSNEEGMLNLEKDINEVYLDRLNLSNAQELVHYVYGVFHSKDYKKRFANDLLRGIPRIPLLKNQKQYIEIGKRLSDLHLNYENVEPYSGVVIKSTEKPSYKVNKMRHPKKGVLDKIIFNNDITITNIPEKAYEYVVNGRPAIEWIIDQYRVKIDKKSGIIDDPNLYSEDDRYIFDLLLRIINVSIQTVDLVNSLPPLEIVD